MRLRIQHDKKVIFFDSPDMTRAWLDNTFPDFNKPSGEAWERLKTRGGDADCGPDQLELLRTRGGDADCGPDQLELLRGFADFCPPRSRLCRATWRCFVGLTSARWCGSEQHAYICRWLL
ncbi:hypothetical protein NDU88_003078 [Pleurodeles waltl]|uniref:Uncharacterized protein n=1 Tax=Pleurodeles waltl TaxID=8319 RepID=A0AAV7QEG4_PLEWA|nr:hypothetical protein NDU88_003078 [Pleurodeles waltl]